MPGELARRTVDALADEDDCCTLEDVTWDVEATSSAGSSASGECLVCGAQHELVVEGDPPSWTRIRNTAHELRRDYGHVETCFIVSLHLTDACHRFGVPADLRRVLVGDAESNHWIVDVPAWAVDRYDREDGVVTVDPTLDQFASRHARDGRADLGREEQLPDVAFVGDWEERHSEWYTRVANDEW